MFFLSLYQLTGGSNVSLDDVQKGPPTLTVDEINNAVSKATDDLSPSQDGLLAQIAELQKQINGLQSQIQCCDYSEIEKQIQALQTLPAQIEALLSQMSDVVSVDPADGDKLIFDGATGKWTQDSRSYLMLE